MTTQRGAVYVRVATEGHPAGKLLAQQEDQLREAAAAYGCPIVQVYRDTGSGRSAERPGFRQLLADAEAGCFDVLFMRDPSRLFRGMGQFQEYYLQLRDGFGVKLVFTLRNVPETGGAQ